MNRYEQRAERQRHSTRKASSLMGTAGVALLVVILLIVGLNGSASPTFYSRAAIGAAVVFLIWRQVARHFTGRTPRSAQPDPRSRIKLTE